MIQKHPTVNKRPPRIFGLKQCQQTDHVTRRFRRGEGWTILENWSTTVRITEFPKSNEIWDQGWLGTGKCWSRRDWALLEFLFQPDTGQEETYSNTSCTIVGHHKCCWKTKRVLLTPGWQWKGEVCVQWISGELHLGGTNSRFEGHFAGVDWPLVPCLIFFPLYLLP